jgi:hypothetical protein
MPRSSRQQPTPLTRVRCATCGAVSRRRLLFSTIRGHFILGRKLACRACGSNRLRFGQACSPEKHRALCEAPREVWLRDTLPLSTTGERTVHLGLEFANCGRCSPNVGHTTIGRRVACIHCEKPVDGVDYCSVACRHAEAEKPAMEESVGMGQREQQAALPLPLKARS